MQTSIAVAESNFPIPQRELPVPLNDQQNCRVAISSVKQRSITIIIMQNTATTAKSMAAQMGVHLRQWRIMLGLSQELAAERADISLPTLRRIERGDTGVRLGSFLAVSEVLNLNERLADATEPLNTDLGRMRAHMLGRKRALRSTR